MAVGRLFIVIHPTSSISAIFWTRIFNNIEIREQDQRLWTVTDKLWSVEHGRKIYSFAVATKSLLLFEIYKRGL